MQILEITKEDSAKCVYNREREQRLSPGMSCRGPPALCHYILITPIHPQAPRYLY